MITKKSILFLLVLGLCFMRPLNAGSEPKGQPFQHLQNQFDSIQLIPGPQGEQGPPGPQGEVGCPCWETPSLNELNALIADPLPANMEDQCDESNRYASYEIDRIDIVAFEPIIRFEVVTEYDVFTVDDIKTAFRRPQCRVTQGLGSDFMIVFGAGLLSTNLLEPQIITRAEAQACKEELVNSDLWARCN